MANKAPKKCPNCKSIFWKASDVAKEDFNLGKAIVSTLLLPGTGIGKRKTKVLFVCEKCGFRQEYDL